MNSSLCRVLLASTSLLIAAGCSGSHGNGDGGQDAVTDGGTDAVTDNGIDAGADAGADQGGDGGYPWTACAFPYTSQRMFTLTDEMGQQHEVADVQVRCRFNYDSQEMEALVRAEPVDMTMMDLVYEAKEGYLCRGGQVERLPAGMFFFSWTHHSWKRMDVAFDGIKIKLDYSETCVGARPCTPYMDKFDVYKLDDSTLLAENLPALCAGVGPHGVPMPLLPQLRVPAQGEDLPFPMGSDAGDPDEQPVHTVQVYPVRMDVAEVGQEDYALFLNDHGNDCDGHPCVNVGGPGLHLSQQDGIWKADSGFEKSPLIQVSWYGASEFCAWRRMVLPSEMLWEAAASELGTRVYPWGSEAPTCALANFDACGKSAPDLPCSLTAGNNAEGVCDLAGNVSEWIADWYQADFYSTCQASYNCSSGPWDDTGAKGVRGGGYQDPANSMRAADRSSAPPAETSESRGFRCMASNPSF
jgi:formylglycine-generating enzyme required for sulfatase activity